MADVNQVITLGIGTPGDIYRFVLVGLSSAAVLDPTADTIVVCQMDDIVVRVTADDVVYVVPPDDIVVRVTADDMICVVPPDDGVFEA